MNMRRRNSYSTRLVFFLVISIFSLILLHSFWMESKVNWNGQRSNLMYDKILSSGTSKVDLRLIVLTYKRPESLAECLNAINSANYLDDNVHLDIWIDQSTSNIIDGRTYKVASDFRFDHGSHKVHNHSVHVGLYGQWLNTWKVNEDTEEIAVFVEDDVNLSPHFYKYLKAAHKKYDSRDEINGYALQGISIKHGGAKGNLRAPPEHLVFLYPILGTWGFSPKVKNWLNFIKWYRNASLYKSFDPLVPHILPSRWYVSFKKSGKEHSMWSMWHIYYAYKQKELTVYPNLDKSLGFSINRKEKGLHFTSRKSKLDPLVMEWTDTYLNFPDNPVILDTNGNVVSSASKAWP